VSPFDWSNPHCAFFSLEFPYVTVTSPLQQSSPIRIRRTRGCCYCCGLDVTSSVIGCGVLRLTVGNGVRWTRARFLSTTVDDEQRRPLSAAADGIRTAAKDNTAAAAAAAAIWRRHWPAARPSYRCLAVPVQVDYRRRRAAVVAADRVSNQRQRAESRPTMDGTPSDCLEPVAVEVELAQTGHMTQGSGLQIDDSVVGQVEAYQRLESVEHRRPDVVELIARQQERAEVLQVGENAVRNEAETETRSAALKTKSATFRMRSDKHSTNIETGFSIIK
jgi:hypothetical protein